MLDFGDLPAPGSARAEELRPHVEAALEKLRMMMEATGGWHGRDGEATADVVQAWVAHIPVAHIPMAWAALRASRFFLVLFTAQAAAQWEAKEPHVC